MSATRPAALAGTVLLALGLVGALVIGSPAAAAQADLSIFDDDAERAMFPEAILVPGVDYTECISVGVVSGGSSDVIEMSVAQVSGAMAATLQVVVEIGTGGSMDSCAGFAATSVLFTGTLTQMAARPSIPTTWHPRRNDSRTFRVKVRIPVGVTTQGDTATGRFVWMLTSPEAPVIAEPSPTTAPSPVVTATARPTAVAPVPLPTLPPPIAPDDPTPSATASPSTSPSTPTVFAPSAPLPPEPPEKAPDVVVGGLLDQLYLILLRAKETLVRIAQQPQYPMGISVVAIGFLVVQDLVDRRDPKLTRATVTQRDNEVEFPDLFGEGLAR